MLQTALASYGMSGEVFHAPLIAAHPDFNLHTIVERTQEKSKARYPEARLLRSFEEVLADPDIDLVVVNTPNPLHFPMTRDALLAGKHVVVEKPFTITVKEGQELIALAEKQRRVLNVFHNKKYEGEFLTVKKLIAENTLGKIKTFETRFDRYRPDIGPKKWKEERNPGAGILYDLGPHIIDQALTLFGMPQSVTSDIQIQREGGQVPDYFRIEMTYATHLVILSAGMLATPPFLKYKIEGEKGTYVKYGNDPQEELLKQGHSPLEAHWGEEPESQWGYIEFENGTKEIVKTMAGSYLNYYTDVAARIKNAMHSEDFAAQARVSLPVMEILERAMEFARSAK